LFPAKSSCLAQLLAQASAARLNNKLNPSGSELELPSLAPAWHRQGGRAPPPSFLPPNQLTSPPNTAKPLNPSKNPGGGATLVIPTRIMHLWPMLASTQLLAAQQGQAAAATELPHTTPMLQRNAAKQLLTSTSVLHSRTSAVPSTRCSESKAASGCGASPAAGGGHSDTASPIHARSRLHGLAGVEKPRVSRL